MLPLIQHCQLSDPSEDWAMTEGPEKLSGEAMRKFDEWGNRIYKRPRPNGCSVSDDPEQLEGLLGEALSNKHIHARAQVPRGRRRQPWKRARSR